MGNTTTQNTTKNTNTFDAKKLFFSVKTRGSSSSTGDTATYNATTRRLTIGAYYRDNGYRSGAVALDDKNRLVMFLDKNGYSSKTGAIHATQNFFTVVKNSPAVAELAKNRKYTIAPLDGVENYFTLTPVK